MATDTPSAIGISASAVNLILCRNRISAYFAITGGSCSDDSAGHTAARGLRFPSPSIVWAHRQRHMRLWSRFAWDKPGTTNQEPRLGTWAHVGAGHLSMGRRVSRYLAC